MGRVGCTVRTADGTRRVESTGWTKGGRRAVRAAIRSERREQSVILGAAAACGVPLREYALRDCGRGWLSLVGLAATPFATAIVDAHRCRHGAPFRYVLATVS